MSALGTGGAPGIRVSMWADPYRGGWPDGPWRNPTAARPVDFEGALVRKAGGISVGLPRCGS